MLLKDGQSINLEFKPQRFRYNCSIKWNQIRPNGSTHEIARVKGMVEGLRGGDGLRVGEGF